MVPVFAVTKLLIWFSHPPEWLKTLILFLWIVLYYAQKRETQFWRKRFEARQACDRLLAEEIDRTVREKNVRLTLN